MNETLIQLRVEVVVVTGSTSPLISEIVEFVFKDGVGLLERESEAMCF